jgi:hypothetical protein
MSLPITLIIDNPAPLINVYWWHIAEQQPGHPHSAAECLLRFSRPLIDRII